MSQLFVNIVTALALPALLLMALAMMAGAKPETLLRPYFGLINTLVRGIFGIITTILRELFKLLRSTPKKRKGP